MSPLQPAPDGGKQLVALAGGCLQEEVARPSGGEQIVHLMSTHIDVWQKPSQYCNYPLIKINK